MALVSPGLQISVTDESQYVPGAVGSVPLVILATQQDKTTPGGAVAAGTTSANAGKLQSYTSQRELVSAFGYPKFQQSAAGTMLHGDERNEYGLMAAYSALGIGNRVYAIRADVDLAQLEGTNNRPTGKVADGTYWLDTAESDFGVFEWNATDGMLEKKSVSVVTSSANYTTVGDENVPIAAYGDVGSYAIVLSPSDGTEYYSDVWNLYYKNTSNVWVKVGRDEWQRSHPTITGTVSSPTITISTDEITVNTVAITLGAGSTQNLAQIVATINTAAVTGITARARNNKIEFLVEDTAASNGVTADGKIAISNSDGTPLALLGITAGTYYRPLLSAGTYATVPAWKSTDTYPRPSGSVFIKKTAVGNGANVVIKKYSANTDTWTAQAAPMYIYPADYIQATDSSGGLNIPVGATWVRLDNNSFSFELTMDYKLFRRKVQGPTVVSGLTCTNSDITSADSFTLKYNVPGQTGLTTTTITLSSGGPGGFVSAILAAGIDEITASYATVSGTTSVITLTHKYGGEIILASLSGTPVADAGFVAGNNGMISSGPGGVILTNFEQLTYTYSESEPSQDPMDGTLWYYSSASAVDIMVNTSAGWKGYLNVDNDARGYDLTVTDPNGVIVSATKPTTQSDGSSALAAGDLWLDSSDLENWPALHRYTGSAWTMIDNTDQIGENGIVFADARWDTDGTTNPISGTLPSIIDLLDSDYIDQDAPDYQLYPRGMLLFNTRRSGYNVKRWVGDYFTETNFSSLPNVPGADSVLPDVAGAWVSASGLKDNGSMYSGHEAQRAVVVAAMKAAVDGNTDVREDAYQFNLIAAPGYPELIANMVSLNNDRANTGFVIGDTPFRLAPTSSAIVGWSDNTDNATGLTTNDPYLGVYYPGAAKTNDIEGNSVVVPPSHIAIRTFLHSDNVSFPWFAPAGTRRGLVDNASSIGYIDSNTGEYVSIGVNQGLRDTLYENKVNPITNLPGVGLVIWGQKTRNPSASSLDRVNVARLVNYIRSVLATVGNGFLFEPNDKITRDQIKNIISGAINDLISKRGIYDYLVVCDESNNTPARIARNELYVDIAIEPTKGVEFIYIPIRLYNPGAIAALG